MTVTPVPLPPPPSTSGQFLFNKSISKPGRQPFNLDILRIEICPKTRIFWRRTLIFMPSMPSQCPYIYRDPVITAAPALLLKQNDWSFIPYPINTSLRSEEHVSLGSAGPGPIRRVITRGRRKPYTLVAPGTLTPPPTSPLSPLSTSSSLTAIGVTDAELVVPVHRPAGTHGKHYNVATELTSNAPTWTMSKFNDLKRDINELVDERLDLSVCLTYQDPEVVGKLRHDIKAAYYPRLEPYTDGCWPVTDIMAMRLKTKLQQFKRAQQKK